MRTTTSKLTTKYQATIPKAVRNILHLKTGDTIAFDIEDDSILIMEEWQSAADEEAYSDL
ncbi:MAG: hypothetical protein B6I36_09640 [Desulfobacteraceae bacterium 4572_35.1]|nr:MAG: hypothetical protein B6I36_09640 [Desulfobacteraceae bacterium 4572_35.1]